MNVYVIRMILSQLGVWYWKTSKNEGLVLSYNDLWWQLALAVLVCKEAQGLLLPASREDSTGTWFSEVNLALRCSVCIRRDGGNQSAACTREGVARSKFSLPNVLQLPDRCTGHHWLRLRLLHSDYSAPYAFHPWKWGELESSCWSL